MLLRYRGESQHEETCVRRVRRRPDGDSGSRVDLCQGRRREDGHHQGGHAEVAQGSQRAPAKLKKALAADSPDWEAIQKTTKDFATLGAALPKNDPPEGDKEDFKKLAESYSKNAKALNEAAKAEDKAEALAAFKKVSTSCMACHKAHKPN